MSAEHIVKQGEHLSGIAAHYGFADYRTIWNHPINAKLKQKRPNPHVLMPGDSIHIPDRESKQVGCATAKLHRFVLSQKPLKLRLKLKDFDDGPLANEDCELEIGGAIHKLTTKADGLLEMDIPGSAGEGKLRIPSLGLEVPVHVGHLDPHDEDSGWQARLTNLGYHGRGGNETTVKEFRHAIEEFQCNHGLKVTGTLDSTTRDKLKQAHGC